MTTLELAVADCWRWLSDPRSSFDGGSWFVRARSLAPLGIICLGSEEGSMQDARFESGLDVSALILLPSALFSGGICLTV